METAGRCCAITRALCCPWPCGKEQCPPDTVLHVPIPGQQWVVVCQCLGWLLPGFQERLRPGARAALGRQDHRVGLPNSESCRCRFCYTGDTALATPAYVCRIQMDCGASGDVGLTTVLPSGSRGTREAGAAGNTRCSQRGTRGARLGRGVWPRPLCGHQRSLGPGATSKGEKQGRRGPRSAGLEPGIPRVWLGRQMRRLGLRCTCGRIWRTLESVPRGRGVSVLRVQAWTS